MLQGVYKLLVGPLLFRSHGFVSFIFLAVDRPIAPSKSPAGYTVFPRRLSRNADTISRSLTPMADEAILPCLLKPGTGKARSAPNEKGA